MAQGSWAYIQFVDSPPGMGGHPEHPIAPGGRPGFGGRPDQGLPGSRPGRPGGGRPVDPGYGIEEHPPEAGQLPVWPVDPDHPIAPPSPGHPRPPIDPPPGTIWPPLPPDHELEPGTKALLLAAIEGVGYRYIVVEIPHADNTLPGEGEGGEEPPEVQPPQPGSPVRPGQGLPRPPGAPPRPGQGLPPGASTKPNPVPTPQGRR